jgi:AcrR family transcriptional regulator
MAGVGPMGGGRAQIQGSNGTTPCALPGCETCRALRAAAVALAVRRGIQAVTSEAIAAEAGFGAEEAARHYPTLDHCLAAAYDESTTHFRDVASRALCEDGSWQDRLRAAAAATVEAFDARPDLARYCVVEAWRSNLPLLRASRLAGRRHYIEMLTDHRRFGGDEDLPEVRMEMFVGAGHHVSGEELEQGDTDSLQERLDGLIEVFEPAMPSPAG